jgi:hypothetical protein
MDSRTLAVALAVTDQEDDRLHEPQREQNYSSDQEKRHESGVSSREGLGNKKHFGGKCRVRVMSLGI